MVMRILLPILIFLIVGGIALSSSLSYSLNSPRMQHNLGVSAADIVCKENLELVIKNNGVPLCVKPLTAKKMSEKGLITLVTKIKDKPVSKIESVTSSSGSTVNFYLYDQDLNLNHDGFDTVQTSGLLEFFINGVQITGPDVITETEVDSGKFLVKITLPDSVNGVKLSQNDILTVKYNDQSDYSGNSKVSVTSIKIQNSPSSMSSTGPSTRIGHRFTLQLYEPDANLDSKEVDRIPLSMVEFRSDGGIRTTLANPAFNANSGNLLETGPNTNLFTVQIEIPREINGKTIDIKASYEFRYIDTSSPSETSEKVKLKGKLGS